MARNAPSLILLAALALAPATAQGGPGMAEKADGDPVARARADALMTELAAGGAGAPGAASKLTRLGAAAHPALLEGLARLKPVEAALALGVLSQAPTPAGRDALVRAARSQHVLLRRAAMENATSFAGERAVAEALVLALRDEDVETVELAQGALIRGQFPAAFPEVLEATVAELNQETPRPTWVTAYHRIVEETLVRARDRADLVAEALRACARVEAPERRAGLYVAAARSGHAALRPLLRALLDEAIPGAPAGAEPVELTSELSDGLEQLRPLREEAIAGTLEAVGRHRMTDAFPAVLRAAKDRRFTIRRAALLAVWPCAPAEVEPRRAAQQALIDALGSADRSLRHLAQGQLRRLSRRNLPPSIEVWTAWLREEDALRALAVRGEEAGYPSVEAYLVDNPEEAVQRTPELPVRPARPADEEAPAEENR